ncbi:hypothetical protein M011DRAFT_471934 [Sporormia fimetaria CBS 119925]|uniref:AB hydrolase-1 domain-containing protein n=1 Tax=Sporormia fimetaria CBS 119925 TaxID=1340428 RepID=A0A6A6V0B5_9PLEO|nr:hypothetical protein M011DRAFT_471934 [Sporormia fimetaria CBS 119925]
MHSVEPHHGSQPPPLPPRQPQAESSMTAMAAHDPRSSSTQSLVPAPDAHHAGRRTLLLVYIHGFMGNETSFQSFPAHLHNLLTVTMAESHVVHTKIYPRYRSRNALSVARDEFSRWLTPNETPFTDVVLLGHSMGGLLAADIALLFHHNILGVVNFDVPFLGMHPGIVKAGLGSIFNPGQSPEDPPSGPETKRPSRMSTFFNPTPSDPNYNPNFQNDIHLPVRKGWENALHFINKHSSNLLSAGRGLVKSHFEFGGAMADYRELKERYARVRALEEDDESRRRSANPGVPHPPRIRFVNYYTASTGRPKKRKSPSPSRPASRSSLQPVGGPEKLTSDSDLALTVTDSNTVETISPRISVDEYREHGVVPVPLQEPQSATFPSSTQSNGDQSLSVSSGPELPEIPPVPQEPPFVDPSHYPDKAQHKAAEKEYTSALKEYKRAVKARNAAIKERTKLEQKWHKQHPNHAVPVAHDETDKLEASEHSNGHVTGSRNGYQAPEVTIEAPIPYANYHFSRSAILAQPAPEDRSPGMEQGVMTPDTNTEVQTWTPEPHEASSNSASSEATPKKKRYKKFCMLPPKDASGNKDPTWVRVYMENMDEVVAHTSLFFMSDTYERLVGDVSARIEEWIRENESMKLVRQMEATNF